MKPRFVIETTNLADGGQTGIARYTRNLIEAMSALKLPENDEFSLTQAFKTSRWRRRHEMASGPRLGSCMWRGRAWPLLRPYDLLHAATDRIPPWSMPLVATVHDLYAALGINYTDDAKRRKKIKAYEFLRDRCERLICVSENTRLDFLRLVGGDPERLHVVHPGVASRFRPHGDAEIAALRERHRIAGSYLLFLGATANKNLARTLQAYAASSGRRDHSLVIGGNFSPAALQELERSVAALGLSGHVHLLAYVDDADLPALYAGASAFLFPSLYEGFGLPILEAMASGVPVLTSNRASCPEAAAGHAVMADPEDIEALSHGIDEALAMSPARRDAARAHAGTKTWESAARATLAIWMDVLAQR